MQTWGILINTSNLTQPELHYHRPLPTTSRTTIASHRSLFSTNIDHRQHGNWFPITQEFDPQLENTQPLSNFNSNKRWTSTTQQRGFRDGVMQPDRWELRVEIDEERCEGESIDSKVIGFYCRKGKMAF